MAGGLGSGDATRAACVVLLLLLGAGSALADTDSDGDGLTDLAERHKYFTDPAKADTDGDGKPDGDADERREYAYTVETRIRVMRPVHEDTLNDDYQDVRVLESTERYLELAVVHYPLATWSEAIRANARWRKPETTLRNYVAPGATSNWDAKLKRTLRKELKEQGVDLAKLDDKQTAEKVSAWLMERAKFRKMFCTYYVEFERGKPNVPKDLEKAFRRNMGDPGWTVKEQFAHELFGRSMFEKKTHGSCTSASVYLQTGLRAAGIPTRSIVCIPAVDASDPGQLEMVRKGVTHHRVRDTILRAAAHNKTSFAAHTFNEVHVGGRWVRLNYAKLGQGTLDAAYMGLMTHVHTFSDLSEAGLTETWGRRYALGQRDDDFPHSNPYRALEVSDRFGEHAEIQNPEVPKDTHTIRSAFWWQTRKDELPSSWMDPSDGRGYLIFEVDPPFRGSQDFILKSEDKPDAVGKGTGNAWQSGRFILLLIRKPAFAALKKGTAYTIEPALGGAAKWSVADGVTVTR